MNLLYRLIGIFFLLLSPFGMGASFAASGAWLRASYPVAAQSIYAGTLQGTSLSDEAQQRNAQLLGGIAAAFASGGDSAATMLASNIALSGMANNRQLHRDEVEWLRNNAQDFADQMGISYDEALAILSAEAASRVDSLYASGGGNPAAAAFLEANRPQGLIASTIGNGDFADHNQEWFAATEYQYTNQLINFQTLQGNDDIYKHLDAVQTAQGGDLDVFVATMVMSADVDDFANLSPAQTIAMIRVTDEAFATSQSLRDQYTQERYDLMIGVALDGAIGAAIQVMDDAAFDALPQADRDYLVDRLVEAYYDIATTAPGGQADGPNIKSPRLKTALDSRLRAVGGVAPNRVAVSEIGELHPPARQLLQGEDVLISSSQGLQSRTMGTFDNVVQGTHGDRATAYLFTIDNRGVNIALESTPAGTPRGHIVHTNLSDRAAIGGEAWFGPNNTVTINAGSGRFGDGAGITQQQWNNTVRYWEGLGYTVNPIPFGSR
jgi:hypothetical protein